MAAVCARLVSRAMSRRALGRSVRDCPRRRCSARELPAHGLAGRDVGALGRRIARQPGQTHQSGIVPGNRSGSPGKVSRHRPQSRVPSTSSVAASTPRGGECSDMIPLLRACACKSVARCTRSRNVGPSTWTPLDCGAGRVAQCAVLLRRQSNPSTTAATTRIPTINIEGSFSPSG
jgi:hypothetical protein